MKNNYLNFYNNLIKLTTNKSLYKDLMYEEDTFGDRLSLFLFHFAFILKEYKHVKNEKILQDLYDFNFRQLELSIREIGYGDQSINKKMKDYINLFYGLLDKIDNWEDLSTESKKSILLSFIENNGNAAYLVGYFDKYRQNLLNNTLNSYLKGVTNP